MKNPQLLCFIIAPLPPESVVASYFQEPGEPISIEVLIYRDNRSIQTHYIIGCSSLKDPICPKTHLLNASAGMCQRAETLFL